MTIDQFAREHRLSTRLDECGDKIIPGRLKRGDGARAERQLYFDGDQLCLMLLDCKPAIVSIWRALGGKLWLGDISQDDAGRRVQDVKVVGIPLANAHQAIRLARVHQRKVISEVKRAALAEQGKATRFGRRPAS